MKIAVIGGGVAGSSVAAYLGSLGLNVSLFEKKPSLVSGSPMCHLHAGGNLYREISDEQCIRLLKESIEFLRFYPKAVDFRPTIAATPIWDKEDPVLMLDRLKKLQKEYENLIRDDEGNRVLGDPKDYYKLYYKEDLLKLRDKSVKKPKSLDDWMAPFARGVDLDKLKYPVILVQEYGLNVFRVAAIATILLNRFENTKLYLNTEVLDVKKLKEGFLIRYKFKDSIKEEKFDFLINSAGFESGRIDDSLKLKRERFVEFKAAYVTKWDSKEEFWPEIIFHGERGTPRGMGQFTPYAGGYFQLHAMRKDVTLFDNGLIKNTPLSSQPKLPKSFIKKIEKEWRWSIVEDRTKKAIDHISNFIPSFKEAKVAAKPLYGAQQIPGDDETLRAAEVSFEGEDYARCEIVKASSVFAMSDEIVKKLIESGKLNKDLYRKRDFEKFEVKEDEMDELAMKFAKERGYPPQMGLVINRA